MFIKTSEMKEKKCNVINTLIAWAWRITFIVMSPEALIQLPIEQSTHLTNQKTSQAISQG